MQAAREHTAENAASDDLPLLSTSERRTLTAIFRHPTEHNLEWSDMAALVEKMGAVDQKANGAFAFRSGHEHHFMHKPHTKDLPTAEIIELRHFLTRAGWSRDAPAQAAPTATAAAPCLLVAIDHHGARLYQIDISSADASEHVIKPYGPHHFLHHMRNKDQSRERGPKQAEDTTYYVRIAEVLAAGGAIILVGHGKGTSNAAHHLAAYLREHHRETYARVVATLTDPQLLALGAQALHAGDSP
jgi:hypothetical protein